MYVQYNIIFSFYKKMVEKESKLIIGISSRALFNLDKSHEIYKKEGLKSYPVSYTHLTLPTKA